MRGLVELLNRNAPAIQATAAVVSAALTAVLAGITAVYVRLTRELATTTRAELELLQADRRTSATERRVRLLALILDVRMIVTVALPRDREHGAAIMHTPLRSPSALDLIKNLAVAYGTDAADVAAEAGRFLATLQELAGVARDGYGAAGSLYWDRFSWDTWNQAIGGSERCLTSLTNLVERAP